MKRIYLAFLACFALVYSNAQVEVTPVTPEEAVALLTGGGVEPFNISYTGDPDQLGFMTGAEGTLYPLSEGIILSTDAAANFDCTFGGGVSGVSGEPDLLEIANSVPPLIGQSFSVSSVNDVCILEFDFVAAGNEVSFNYSFGSDEYLEWVNSSFNDVFAFFLSGPGIIGDYDSPPEFPNGAINLAVVPDSDPELPITISSVNNTLNDEYYINNPSNVDVCSDGFTVSLTVSNTVICGETYHIKLAIADGSDTALESIVVLEAGSFDSNGVFITADPSIESSFEFANDTILVEGCNEGVFTLFRADSSIEEEVFFTISGSATEGVDYPDLPESVTFGIGDFAAEVPIEAFEDFEDEDMENLTISYTFVNTCGDSVTSSATLWMVDHIIPDLVPEDLLLYECSGTGYLQLEVAAGYPEFSWEWYNTATETSTFNSFLLTSSEGTYEVTVTDPCGASDTETIDVVLVADDPPPLAIDNDTFTVECPGDFGTIDPGFSGGAPQYFYLWDGPDVGGWEEPTFTTVFNENSTYEITVADQCGQIVIFEVFTVVPEYDPIVITADDVESPCPGAEVTLSASAVNGFAPLEYFWGTDGSGQNIQVSPEGNTTYQVEVQDNCGNVESELVQVTIGDPDPIFIDDLFPQCLNLGQPLAVSGGFPPLFYEFDEEAVDVDGDVIIGTALGVHTLTVFDECGATETVNLEVIGCETVVPNIFTPGNDDDFNDFLFIEGLEAFPDSKLSVYNRWGNLVFEESNYLNDWDGDDLPEGTYYWILERSDGDNSSGYIQIVRE